MPPVPPPTTDPPWKAAWDDALYGAAGFFRRESPGAHFRTSVHASPLFAAAVVRLVREARLDTVVDIGAGRGELLRALRPYVEDQLDRGVYLKHITRHLLGLFAGERGGRAFRQVLSEGAHKPGSDWALVEQALAVTESFAGERVDAA